MQNVVFSNSGLKVWVETTSPIADWMLRSLLLRLLLLMSLIGDFVMCSKLSDKELWRNSPLEHFFTTPAHQLTPGCL